MLLSLVIFSIFSSLMVGTSSSTIKTHESLESEGRLCTHCAPPISSCRKFCLQNGCSIESIRDCLAAEKMDTLPQCAQELPLHQIARVLFSAFLLGLALLVCACAIGTRCTHRPCHRIHDINGVYQHQQQGAYHDNPSTTFIYGSPYNVFLIAIDISRMGACRARRPPFQIAHTLSRPPQETQTLLSPTTNLPNYCPRDCRR